MKKPINTLDPNKWKISLPIHPPDDVSDNSERSTYRSCMRLGLYQYGLQRGMIGINFSFQFGTAYHDFRERMEDLMREMDEPELTDEIFDKALEYATRSWEDPPIGHPKEFLDYGRLTRTCMEAAIRVKQEIKSGQVTIMRSEDSFDLELPYVVCYACGNAWLVEVEDYQERYSCQQCGKEEGRRARHGGRSDQFTKFLGGLHVRDFKTTSYKHRYLFQKYEMNSQTQGYYWAGSLLSGRRFDGVLIEQVYNTKRQGPDISQIAIEMSAGAIEQWIASQMMWDSFIRTAYSRVGELGYLAFPQNTEHCTQYGLCKFYGACQESSGKLIDKWLEAFTVEKVWDFTNPDGDDDE